MSETKISAAAFVDTKPHYNILDGGSLSIYLSVLCQGKKRKSHVRSIFAQCYGSCYW